MTDMQDYFYKLADRLTAALRGGEVILMEYSGEDSDFVRFNKSVIRQPGSVSQRYLSLELIQGKRHVRSTAPLVGNWETDGPAMAGPGGLLEQLRQMLPHVPEDPYLLYSTQVNSGETKRPDRLPKPDLVVERILRAGQGRDMVGILAMGGIHAGFANSLGQRNWFSTHSFHYDWSFYLRADKAVKTSYAGFEWSDADFDAKVATAAEQLAMLDRPAKTVEPGEYRVYLAPAALEDFVSILCWGGFGLKSHRTKNTPLLKMIEDGWTLSPLVTLRENTREGISPAFQSEGFLKPDAVTLIEGGKYRDCLVSPRSAKEYGLATNGAGAGESPESLDLSAGSLDAQAALAQLCTGVYVNQLWYLNYSDRPGGRITGMTRFATFWVENGRIQAPLNVMRFDETVYRVLGENLLGLTAQRDFIPSASTYIARATSSGRVPGALVNNFRFTL